ncbi:MULTISPECIES: fumarylacetoacetate hydrolase family protein [unclassified Haladaptatus]|uniref:2-keto-4-pentenoate hydratase n=1 Tax=unclassified Haladaptatus TaxID=2622732 RepID=UPI00209C03DF|nr:MULTISPECIES: fumarylacetoacetate hydrolase family protein [unclassified Haladaptatus]MCO8243648.1 fumarylacetoacetate hydrolase family protein [Haladaptatus sp. AB643]MCO8255057.1 fumarylacetoacetate hydrolase family protein [Haladaptatus sp. AB618]
MALSQDEIDTLATKLYDAYSTKEPIPPLTDEAEFSTADAYRIQFEVFDRLTEADRENAVGHKLGLVSEAKQDQLGIPEPIFGYVAPETVLEGEPVPTDEMIAPRIEAEIGFIIDEDLTAPVSTTDVLTSTRAVVPVLEILESRYQGWSIPSAQDVIADLTSAGKVVVGESFKDVTDVDLRMESIVISVNGETQASGVGADIMGHPARAVAWLANRLDDLDDGLRAGELVMSGGITAAIDIEPGDVYSIEFANLGSVELRAE